MVDQQLQLAKRLLIRPRPAQTRLPQRGPRDRERIDRVRLAARPARTSFRRHQLRRHPHQFLTRCEQLPLEPARQLATILERPQPLLVELAGPRKQLVVRRPTIVLSSSIRPASSTATAVTECLCTSTPITIIQIASSTVGGDRRADRPHSRQLPSSYQVTLGGLGSAAATQRWQVSPRATCGNRVSRRRPSLCHSPDATTTPRMTVSSGMSLERGALPGAGRVRSEPRALLW